MLKLLWNTLERYTELRANYILLTNMTDRELKDIGISRGEIKDRIMRS
jgi:uncharacterized protein YjiS (DUF1127 family)